MSWRRVLSVMRKEWWHITRDRTSFVLLMLSPVLFLVTMGYAFSIDIVDVGIGVMDQDLSPLSRQYVAQLGSTDALRLVARPQSLDRMQGIDGFKSFHQRRYGREIISAVTRGIDGGIPHPPSRPPRPPDEVLGRYEALRRWRKRTAARRGVDPDVVVSNAVLWTLAQHVPHTPDQLVELNALGPWKRRTYGEALLAVLRRHGG